MSKKKEFGLFVKDLLKGPGLAFSHHPVFSSLFVTALIGFIVFVIYRFSFGLGITGLNDLTAWGLWTVLKLSFVVVSGCAFALTGMVYIFKMDRFRPLVRSAALIGFLGYTTFAITLIFELGWPWRIVHPIWMHNYYSILFEIAWCVMLYLTVLSLEFIPNILERFKKHKLLNLFKKATPTLVIAGVILSILHQSSLGSMFVIAPYKMNHLWFSPWLGPFFIISAVFCGFALIIVSELLMAAFDKRKPYLKLLDELGKYSVPFLGLYLGFKIFDILDRGTARRAFAAGDMHTLLFIVELGFGILLPIFLYGKPRVRSSKAGLALTATLVIVFGGILNRVNVSVIALDHSPLGYTPTFIEFIYIPLTVILVTGIYVIITRLFPIMKEGIEIK
jgi:Ni/Fe-hydrogenase subunit HybB-like protein